MKTRLKAIADWFLLRDEAVSGMDMESQMNGAMRLVLFSAIAWSPLVIFMSGCDREAVKPDPEVQYIGKVPSRDTRTYAVRLWPAGEPIPGETVWMDGDRLMRNIEAGVPVTVVGVEGE